MQTRVQKRNHEYLTSRIGGARLNFETDSLNNRKRKETARITIDEGSLRVDRWTGKRTLATERAISPGFIDFRICRRRQRLKARPPFLIERGMLS